MNRIWRGDTTLDAAMRARRLDALGGTPVLRAFPRWLGTSTLAHIRPQRQAAE